MSKLITFVWSAMTNSYCFNTVVNERISRGHYGHICADKLDRSKLKMFMQRYRFKGFSKDGSSIYNEWTAPQSDVAKNAVKRSNGAQSKYVYETGQKFSMTKFQLGGCAKYISVRKDKNEVSKVQPPVFHTKSSEAVPSRAITIDDNISYMDLLQGAWPKTTNAAASDESSKSDDFIPAKNVNFLSYNCN